MKPGHIAILALLLLLASCDADGGAANADGSGPAGVETTGLELFEERVVGSNPGCITCHSREEGVTLVGPSLFAVESPVGGMTTADYIRQSILQPDAYLVAGFAAGQMSANWDVYLTAEQIESLVELLATSP